jgi:hypothetical protein
MRGGLFIVAATVALLAAPTAYALLGQHGVKTTRLYEQLPAAATDGSTNYFAWAQNSRSRPNHFDAFLTRTGQPRVKLNSRGEGYVGGIDPPKVAYQQVVNGQSDVKIYDADQQTRPALPNGVNTGDWEWEPSISGKWLLFGRQTSSTQFVILASLDPATPTQTVLDQGRRFRHAGQVNGDFAIWTRCTRESCNAVRRVIMPGTTNTSLQKPSKKFQYAAAVTSTGIAYVARSGPKCGADVKIVRYFGATDDADGTVVADLGTNGRDFWSAYARANRYVCGTGKSDIYRINDPHPGP